jgi:hypothetical protein
MSVYNLVQAKGGHKLRPSLVKVPLSDEDMEPLVPGAKTDAAMMVAFETGTFFNGKASQAHIIDKTRTHWCFRL